MPVLREIKTLTRMAAPVAATQMGSMAMGFVDIIMVGHYGDRYDDQALAAVSLGDIWVFGTLIIGIGIMMGLDPVVSQAHGAGDGDRAGRALQRGIVLAVLLSIPLMVAWPLAAQVLTAFGQDGVIAQKAAHYTGVQTFSAAPFLIFIALRQYLQGRGMMAVALWIVLLANVFNALVNWVLIFGHLGVPPLGLHGAGLATALTRYFMMAALVVWVLHFRLHRGAWVPWGRHSTRSLGEVLAHGIPVGIQLALEVWAFQISGLLAGRLGVLRGDTDGAILASHTVALKLAAFSFMVPMGIAIASATRVGNLIGAGHRSGAQRAAWVALGMGATVMVGAALVFVVGRHDLPRMFTRDLAVIALSSAVLPVAATFQLFDGVQAVGAGVLRGMGDTRPAAIFNLLGFYLLGIPVAYVLAFHLDMGLPGIWWGLCAGLAVVAVLLVAWIHWRGPLRSKIGAV